jgi:hypothetical protein
MPEHLQIQQSKKPDTIFQKQTTQVNQIPLSNPMAIIQRAKINPKSLTHADVMQLQRTIGNRAVSRLLSGIGNFSTAQQAPVQRQEISQEETCPSCMQRQEIPEEEEPLQGKMIETIQRQEIPEEEEPLQGKMIETIQRQEIQEEEEPLQGKMADTVQRQEVPEEEEPLQGKMIGTIQRQEIPEEEEPLQGKMIEPLQRQEIPEEEEPLQGKMAEILQRQEIPEEEEPLQTKRENNTGMPDNLKAGMENLSGIDMSDVRVHYNSDKPAEVGALAYTQGADIHVASGQERHLPHEAWHVVQQKQGRVQPTMQMKDGVPVNDDEGLEHEADVMGDQASASAVPMAQLTTLPSERPVEPLEQGAVHGREPQLGRPAAEPANTDYRLNTTIRSVSAPVQRVLVVDSVPLHHRSGGIYKHRTFDNAGNFKEFVKVTNPVKVNYSERFWNTPTMGKYLKLVEEPMPPQHIVQFEEIIANVRVAEEDAERLDTLDPEGPVPEHHELATFADEPQCGLHGHSAGPVGYAGKMMGKPKGRDDFASLLNGVGTVVLTTGTIADVAIETGVKKSEWKRIDIPVTEVGGGRRPGLSIINYSDAIYGAGAQLAVCGVRGKILMDQFGLAIREFVHANTGRSITIKTIFKKDAVQENYSRLRDFFKEHTEFQEAHTVVFGYASAFEDAVSKDELSLIKRTQDKGWVGYLFKRKDAGRFAVFDSDSTHSYHGEILAQNVKLLLEDPVGNNVAKVMIGGSAGSLVAPGGGTSGGASSSSDFAPVEERLVPNGIYIPEAILRPDGFFKINALHNVEMPDTRELAMLPGSMHTSVVSVLAETPSVLADLVKFGVKTVDMEFAYVAMVLGKAQPSATDRRDLADVKLGVACLVTDFPKTGAQNVALAAKNDAAKKATKALFVRTVIAAMK